jgi:(4-O-methyl)-D-glucuronate---lignin esterase
MAFDKNTQAKFDRMNLDENKVKSYKMPEVLQAESAFEWYNKIRPYYLNEFKKFMYGDMPPRPDIMEFELLDCKNDVFNNLATRKIIRMHFKMHSEVSRFADMLLYIPNGTKSPAPAFMGLNFASNAACTLGNDIPLSHIKPVKSESGFFDIYPAQENERGNKAGRWPFEQILKRGYAVATCYCNDFFLDHPTEGFNNSIFSLFYPQEQLKRKDNNFGAIGAWAWGLSRMLDYMESDKDIDASKVAVLGHSRLGKTALWAGACDPRFAMIISNGSGCGGAKLSRRNFGENFEWLLHWRPYWFHKKLQDYINREAELHFDQHTLISLCAPRPVYVASGSEDHYADPRGEFTSLKEAGAIYSLFGSKGLDAAEMPPAGESIQNDLGYHVHKGAHNIGTFDWDKFLDFADLHFKSTFVTNF